MTKLEMFKNFCRYMMLQDESLYNIIWELIETCDQYKDFRDYIDTKYPTLSKYIILNTDDGEGLVYYMEHIEDRANKQFLAAYLVANYLSDKRQDLIEKYSDDWNIDIDSISDYEITDERIKSDEALENLYNELEEFAKGIVKPKVNNIIVNNKMDLLFDLAKQGNGKVVTTLTLNEIRDKRTENMETIQKMNTEQYAKLLVEYIQAVLKRASEMHKTDGYILARHFEDYNLGRLKFGDEKAYFDEYYSDDDDYLIASREFDENDLKTNPSYDSLDCFSIDGDILTMRLNFSSKKSSNDLGDTFTDGGKPRYIKLNFDYLKELLWNQGIDIEEYDDYETHNDGWESTYINVLTIRYYRNEKDRENIAK